jgi:hypothetical protein
MLSAGSLGCGAGPPPIVCHIEDRRASHLRRRTLGVTANGDSRARKDCERLAIPPGPSQLSVCQADAGDSPTRAPAAKSPEWCRCGRCERIPAAKSPECRTGEAVEALMPVAKLPRTPRVSGSARRPAAKSPCQGNSLTVDVLTSITYLQLRGIDNQRPSADGRRTQSEPHRSTTYIAG